MTAEGSVALPYPGRYKVLARPYLGAILPYFPEAVGHQIHSPGRTSIGSINIAIIRAALMCESFIPVVYMMYFL